MDIPLVLSNVPGPRRAVSIAGKRVLTMFGCINNRSVFTAFSYNGELRISYTSSEHMDAEMMMTLINQEVEALLAAKQIQMPEPKRPFVSPIKVMLMMFLTCI